MTDIPIIFSASMVRALLDGRKTMTRRLAWRPARPKEAAEIGLGPVFVASTWQRVKAGDRLYVRETWSADHFWSGIKPSEMPSDHMAHTWYWADGNPDDGDWTNPIPSIFIPRWRSRITLVVTDTKVERLGAISEADAFAEGVGLTGLDDTPFLTYSGCFWHLWATLHGQDSLAADPDVVAVSFRVIKANIDAPEAMAA